MHSSRQLVCHTKVSWWVAAYVYANTLAPITTQKDTSKCAIFKWKDWYFCPKIDRWLQFCYLCCSHETITSYLKGEVGRLESSVSPSESLTEGKTSSSALEMDPVKANEKLKPKSLQGTNRREPKAVIGEHKSSLPVSAKRTGIEEGRSRPHSHADEGTSAEKVQ